MILINKVSDTRTR